MHPEILRELATQRGNEMRTRAHKARLARMASRALREGSAAAEEFAVPAIPDYVDGSFRATPADGKAAGKPRQVLADRRAA